MTTKRANFLIDQINPILRKSTSYIRKLELDSDNFTINMVNVFNAILYRVDYAGRSVLEVSEEIIENALY